MGMGVRYILVPSVVEYAIMSELAKTFNDDTVCKVLKLCDTVITNYASQRQVEIVKNEIREKLKKWMDEYKDGDEVYVLLVGSNFNISETIKLLERAGIEYKRLVFERKIDKYAIIE